MPRRSGRPTSTRRRGTAARRSSRATCAERAASTAAAQTARDQRRRASCRARDRDARPRSPCGAAKRATTSAVTTATTSAPASRRYANGQPKKRTVSANVSTPSSGVASRNATTIAAAAPRWRSECATGSTPHAHTGSGSADQRAAQRLAQAPAAAQEALAGCASPASAAPPRPPDRAATSARFPDPDRPARRPSHAAGRASRARPPWLCDRRRP